jgi:hypothetical protein
MDEIPIRAKNLLGKFPKIYNQTIWSRLEDRYNITLNGVSPNYTISSYRENNMGSFVTELFGHDLVSPQPSTEAGAPYIFSSNFWTNNTSAMTSFETLVHTAITQRQVGDLSTLISVYLTQVSTLSPMNQYYYVPFYIHFIDIALHTQYRQIDAPSMGLSPNG